MQYIIFINDDKGGIKQEDLAFPWNLFKSVNMVGIANSTRKESSNKNLSSPPQTKKAKPLNIH